MKYEDVIELYPKIAEIVEYSDITPERVMNIIPELSKQCGWCPMDYHCPLCAGIVDAIRQEAVDEDELYKDYQEYCNMQKQEELNEVVWDSWENNIGECESYFYGVCKGELTGDACKKPSKYGCSFKLPSSP